MVNVGNVSFGAQITGATSASKDADKLIGKFYDISDSSQEGADSVNDLSGGLEEYTNVTDKARVLTSRFTSFATLLTTRLTGLKAVSLVTSAAMGAYSLAAKGAAVSTGLLSGALLGPTALVGGLAAAILGVGLLSSELAGVTDVTPIAARELDGMAGLAMDLGYIIAGPVPALIGAGFAAITGDTEKAKQLFSSATDEWVNTSARFAARAMLGLKTFGIAIETTFLSAKETMIFAMDTAVESVVTRLNRMINTYNSVVSRVGGDTITVDNIEFEAASLNSRIESVRNSQREKLNNARTQTQSMIDNTRNNTNQKTVNNNNVEVNVVDEGTFDGMSEFDKRNFASDISDYIADDINRSVD